jgi:lysophospholipase L1-like esterase
MKRGAECFLVAVAVAGPGCPSDGGVSMGETEAGASSSGGTSAGATLSATAAADSTGGAVATSDATEGGGTTTDGGSDPGADSSSGGDTGGAPPGSAAACFRNAYVNDFTFGPDYDQFGVTVGSHCLGTNHQDIDGIERVVFLGDSVTVGTPPHLPDQYYRSVLADMLAAQFGLAFGVGLEGELAWKAPNPFTGQAVVLESGDFAACAEWGARNDDLLQDGNQIGQCFSKEDLQARTLVVFTSGGNDINAITQDAIDGVPNPDLWLMAEDMILRQREAIDWLEDPGRFPNGVFVVYANPYEFTDGTGEVESCDVSALAGFDQPVPAPRRLKDLVVWIEEEYGRMAVETGTDMIFLLEEFCGHGFNADNPEAPCYRGPGAEVWFDLTCIHPNPTGHQHIADMFMAVVTE